MSVLIKSLTTSGFRKAVIELAKEFRILWMHRAALRRVSRYVGVNLRLNIGCGSNVKQGWINIDLCGSADLQLDLRESLPFADETVSMIYSEHFFEHLEYPDQALSF